MHYMTTAEKAKAAGLLNLKELSELTGQTTDTLRRWDKNKSELFQIVLKGAVVKRLEGIK